MADFKDHFSKQSSLYRAYRPSYPRGLFEYLASVAPTRACAWDCATGTGQAAVMLAEYFEQVVATDASAEQISNARPHPRIIYKVERAERSRLEAASIDLVVVAQALHWFDCESFYREVERVLRPDGVLAAWCYSLCSVSPEVDAAVERLYEEMLGPYWPNQRRLVEAGYATVSFPFVEIEAREFSMVATWPLEHFLGYLSSWSAVQRYKDQKGKDPVDSVSSELGAAWGDQRISRDIRWPIAMRVGRVEGGRE